ncbi:MAG: ATP-dependent sacrificial sulfur transferase LarE [Bacteroidales bacterium]|nr:ATP-dependent sacrificial sulfur transferase LarE [Bacteroidales bacterium]
MREVRELADSLEKWIERIDRAAVALSGGIDSSLVAYAARMILGKDAVVAIISASASVKQKDLDDARSFCAHYDITLTEIDAEEIKDSRYAGNPVNRCYFCKTALYQAMEKLIQTSFPGYTVLNGNNYSDFGDFRPGLQAADQHQVLSPLAACKFAKEDIRRLAAYYQLPNWNKPASPCLSSRFPYGESITHKKLRMVEDAESVLNRFGFGDVRVRYSKQTATIEVPGTEVARLQQHIKEISPLVTAFGFTNVKIDEEGLVSGKLNRNISKAI